MTSNDIDLTPRGRECRAPKWMRTITYDRLLEAWHDAGERRDEIYDDKIGAEGPTARNCMVRGQRFLAVGEEARLLCIRKMNPPFFTAALLRAIIACNGNGRKITAPGRRVARNKLGI